MSRELAEFKMSQQSISVPEGYYVQVRKKPVKSRVKKTPAAKKKKKRKTTPVKVKLKNTPKKNKKKSGGGVKKPHKVKSTNKKAAPKIPPSQQQSKAEIVKPSGKVVSASMSREDMELRFKEQARELRRLQKAMKITATAFAEADK